MVEGTKSDILATSCEKCWDMKDLRGALAALEGSYVSSDDVVENFVDYTSKLQNAQEFTRKINLFVKNENNKEVREDFILSGPEIAQEILDRIDEFVVHIALIKNENLHTEWFW